MPQTVNLTGGGAQLGTALVRSVTFSSYASVTDQSVEVPPAQAHYFVGHMFGANNGGLPDFGQFSIDTTDIVFEHYGRANIQDLLVALFPPALAPNA